MAVFGCVAPIGAPCKTIDLYSRRVVGWAMGARMEVVESFFSTLKLELDHDDVAETLQIPQQLNRHLAFWIDGYYNRERRHSAICYLSPIDYYELLIGTRRLTGF